MALRPARSPYPKKQVPADHVLKPGLWKLVLAAGLLVCVFLAVELEQDPEKEPLESNLTDPVTDRTG